MAQSRLSLLVHSVPALAVAATCAAAQSREDELVRQLQSDDAAARDAGVGWDRRARGRAKGD
jgi:hypothetical protein